MRRWLYNLFAGRYGIDTTGRCVLLPSVLLMTICLFLPLGWVRFALQGLAFAGTVYVLIRAMSRNIYRRRRENEAFVEFFKINYLKIKEHKTHRWCRCPKCRAMLRVPRGIGEITIKCRVCEHRFDKKV